MERDGSHERPAAGRRRRVDAERNLRALLDAAKSVFAKAGTDAPVRAIADRAGVGVGTIYRHFPSRAQLVAAVFASEIDACAASADRIAATHPPAEALALWMDEFVRLLATKRGLAGALHSGDPAYDSMPARRDRYLYPAFRRLFEAAKAAGEVRDDIDPDDVLNAAATLSAAPVAKADQTHAIIRLLIDGLRHRPSA